MVGDLHIVEFQLCLFDLIVITSHRTHGAPWTWGFTTPNQFLGARRSNFILSPLLRMCCWVLVVVSHQFPGAGWNKTQSNSSFTWLFEALESCGGIFFVLRRFLDTKLFGLGFDTDEPSLAVLSGALLDMTLCLLCSKEIGCKKHRENLDVQQSKMMVPFITCKTTFGQHVNIFDLDFGVQIVSVKQPIKRNSVGSWHVSHRWTSVFDDHFDHCIVLQKFPALLCIEKCAFVLTWSTCDNWSTSRFAFRLGLDLWFRDQFPASPWVGDSVLFHEPNTSITTFHKSRAGSPSIRKPT